MYFLFSIYLIHPKTISIGANDGELGGIKNIFINVHLK